MGSYDTWKSREPHQDALDPHDRSEPYEAERITVKQFRDTKDRRWDVQVNVATIKRVRDLVGVDLLAIVEGKLVEKLARDPILLCDVIYAVCREQADERKISDEDFGRAMAGDAIDEATAALLQELVDFSPSPRDRANLGRILQATNRVMDRARDLLEQKIESGELERVAEEALQSAINSSGSVPGSSESIPPE